MDPYLRASKKFPHVKNQAEERRSARRQKDTDKPSNGGPNETKPNKK